MQGKVFKYKDDVDTDVIIPARYLNDPSLENLSKHCMEDIDPTFSSQVEKGDYIVAGYNFGCGSSREHAPLSIKACKVSAVIAKSFARIFYRNAINIGFPIFECEEAVEDIDSCDIIDVDTNTGIITNITKNKTYKAKPFPDFIKKIMEHNGYLEYLGEEHGI